MQTYNVTQVHKCLTLRSIHIQTSTSTDNKERLKLSARISWYQERNRASYRLHIALHCTLAESWTCTQWLVKRALNV